MSTWTEKYANDLANLSSTASQARKFHDSFASAIAAFKGGMPGGLMAAIAIKESNGRMVGGDASLAEFGFFQITGNFPTTVGLSPELRKTENGNVFLAGLEYNIEAQRMKVRYPDLVVDGTMDQWMLARAVFALGIGAMTKLISLVSPSRRGRMFGDITDFVDANPNVSVSGYEAGKVWYRIKSIPLLWRIGQLSGASMSFGAPVQVPAPGGLVYTLPKDVRSSLPKAAAGGAMLALAAGGALFWWWRSRR